MGRELRMVPPNWKHPRDDNGRYIPLLQGSFAEALNEWLAERAKYPPELLRAKWAEGLRKGYGDKEWEPFDPKYAKLDGCEGYYGKESGPAPFEYMPDFAPGTATHFCMYESTSEGTPISPAFETPEKLARWLADNNASAFARQGASYESWLDTIKRGWAMSAMAGPNINGLVSGVEGMAAKKIVAPATSKS